MESDELIEKQNSQDSIYSIEAAVKIWMGFNWKVAAD